MMNETDLASWMKAVKAAARGGTPSDAEHEAAVRVCTIELSSHEQMALAHEIFATRSAELCRAYRNLVDVTYGFRRPGGRRTADENSSVRPASHLLLTRSGKVSVVHSVISVYLVTSMPTGP